MDLTADAIERFKADIYATQTTGIEITKAERNYAECHLKIDERHLNAAGFVMGGVMFTLADFCFAVASNTENPLTVTLSSTINYIRASKSSDLYAIAKCIKDGKNVCFFEILITDSEKEIAKITCQGFRKS